jgi:hypothetical protein
VLAGSRSDHFKGAVPPDQQILVSATANRRWQLAVGGRSAPRRTAFGWAMAFGPTQGGTAVLRFRTPFSRTLEIVIEMLVWIAAAVAVMVGRRRRRPGEEDEPAATAAFEWLDQPARLVVGPAGPVGGLHGPSRPRPRPRPSRVADGPGGDPDELWR